MRPGTPPRLPDLPQNAALLEFLRAQASPPSGPHDWTLGEWQLHTHTDLWGRLTRLVPGHPLHAAYGVPVLAHEGIAAAVVLGMGTLLVRLPSPPHSLKAGGPRPPLTDHGWQSVDPWQSHLLSAEGDRRLSGVLRGALAHARELIA
ncbi:hypothetical protein ACWCXB_27380 [Streptomyces sp. NPDC001514]